MSFHHSKQCQNEKENNNNRTDYRNINSLLVVRSYVAQNIQNYRPNCKKEGK